MSALLKQHEWARMQLESVPKVERGAFQKTEWERSSEWLPRAVQSGTVACGFEVDGPGSIDLQ